MLNRKLVYNFRPPVKHKPLKPLNVVRFKKLAIAIAIVLVAVFCYVKVQPYTQDAKQQRQLETKSIQLKKSIRDLEKQKSQGAQTQKQLEDTQKQLQDTQKQLEAKRNAATAYAAELAYTPPAPVYKAPVVTNTAPSGCGDNTYANYIYMHESGCRTDAVNEIGACGIGQAYPCGKMGCSLSDYACQNAFFNNYAIQRYGSWEAAYYYWLNNRVW